MTSRLRTLLAGLCFFLSILPGEALAQVRVTVEPQEGDRTGPAGKLNEIVAVGWGRGLVTLATPVAANQRWRYRTILVQPAEAELARVALSRSGTKALLHVEGGTRRAIDLSRAVYGISTTLDPPPPSHRLPRQVFATVDSGRLVVLDDLGAVRPEYDSADPGVGEIVAAAAHDDGTILFATRDGTLSLYDPTRRTRTELGFRVPPETARVHVLGGSVPGGLRFVLVLEEAPATRIVDPVGGGAPLRSHDDPLTALLDASLILAYGADHGTSEADMRTLSSQLARRQDAVQLALPRARGAAPAMEWSFFHVVPDVSLYAPVLELASQERVFPSSIFIWDELQAQLDVSAARAFTDEEDEAFYRAYLRLGDSRKAKCTLYQRVRSYPGSWLIEYWIYYPFDVGGLGPHPHDAEHLFVEVDKLGGTISALFGGAHGELAPNNTYLTLDDGAQPVELPLFAMVELGKHASAPDVNRDGFFTPGLDENYFTESAKVWGVRDAFGTKDSHFLPYDLSMMAPRRKEHWLAIEPARELFPEMEIAEEGCRCRIETFLDAIAQAPLHHPRSQQAARILKTHPDAVDPRTMFKPWVFPRSFLRLGAGNDRETSFPAVQAAYVRDLERIPLLSVLPGRLAFEVSYTPWVEERGSEAATEEVRRLDFGIRYERLVSNLFGFYAGLHKGVEIVNLPDADSLHWAFQEGVWLSVGPMVEIPFWKSNFLFQAGAAFREGTSPAFEFRIAFGAYQKSRWFWGIGENQKTPY